MKKKVFTIIGALLVATALTQPAAAESVSGKDWLARERFILRARALGVVPDESADVNVGGKLTVGNALVPEVDVSYFFTDHIAAEIIAGTAKHTVKHNGGDLGDVWILPPTVTLQYHFSPKQAFSPYVGAGLNYSILYGEDAKNGFNDLHVDNGFGYAVQAGFDYWVSENWGVNLDVKKIWLNVDAKSNGGVVRADIDLDPWLIGAGVAFRF